MKNTKLRIGKKDGAQRVAEEFAKIRKAPLPEEVFSIVDENNRKRQPKSNKKSAKSNSDLGV